MLVREAVSMFTITSHKEGAELFNRLRKNEAGEWFIDEMTGSGLVVVAGDVPHETPEQAFMTLMNTAYWR